MQPGPPSDELWARILEEVKRWAASRYGAQVNEVSPVAANISPDRSGHANYIVRLNLVNIPNAPNSIQVKASVEPNGNIAVTED